MVFWETHKADIEAKSDGEQITHIRVTFPSGRRYMAATFDFINDSDPRFAPCPPVEKLKMGDIAHLAQLAFRCVEIDRKGAKVLFERAPECDLQNVLDDDGWFEAIK